MKGVQSNIRHLARVRGALVLLPVLVLPLGMAGVTIRPVQELREARSEEERLELLVELCRQRRQELEDFGSLDKLTVVEDLRQRLHDLVPDSLEPIDIYSHARHAARAAGVELGSLRLLETSDTQLVIGDETIAQAGTALSGEASLGSLAAFIADLDARGLPVSVTRLGLSRDRHDRLRFRFDLDVGFYHYAPSGSMSSESGDSMVMDPLVE